MENKSPAIEIINKSLQDITGLSFKVKDDVKEHIEKHDCRKHNFDFMDVKNTLFISYLIELVRYIKLRTANDNSDVDDLKKCVKRLNEMRVVLDKMRPMEKKLSYQLQKLLAVAENLGSESSNDPLSFRPDMSALDSTDDEKESEELNNSEEDSENDDDELKAAKSTARAANNVYKAPRIAAVPYDDKEAQAKKLAKDQARQASRMRNSEVMQALRHQYSDRPEEDDIHGGSKLGTTKEAARKIAAREAEKTSIEESTFMRIRTSKKDRKEKNKVAREEHANLNHIADVGGLVTGVAAFERSQRSSSNQFEQQIEHKVSRKRSSSSGQPKNALQALAFGGGGKKNSKKKRSR